MSIYDAPLALDPRWYNNAEVEEMLAAIAGHPLVTDAEIVQAEIGHDLDTEDAIARAWGEYYEDTYDADCGAYPVNYGPSWPWV